MNSPRFRSDAQAATSAPQIPQPPGADLAVILPEADPDVPPPVPAAVVEPDLPLEVCLFLLDFNAVMSG